MKAISVFSLLSVLLVTLNQFECFSVELSAIVEPNSRECFHQYLKEGLTVETDFQVITGGDGLDITFWASSPRNVVVTHLQRQQAGKPVFKTSETGEYRFCFDNSFSRFSAKQVHFYIGTSEAFTDPIFSPKPVFEPESSVIPDELGELEDKLENFRTSFHTVLQNLDQAKRFQELFKHYESIDRSLMEHNFDRVNLYSIINVFVMLTVAAIQVFMIRSLFEDRSKVGRILRGESTASRKTLT